MRVLIVEDDAGVARLLRMILERDGHDVSVAEDGGSGRRELAGPAAPHLLILDRMLPDMDGADLLHGLRADESTARLPVLVLTAGGMSGGLGDVARTRILAKPFDLGDLRAALAELAAP